MIIHTQGGIVKIVLYKNQLKRNAKKSIKISNSQTNASKNGNFKNDISQAQHQPDKNFLPLSDIIYKQSNHIPNNKNTTFVINKLP